MLRMELEEQTTPREEEEEQQRQQERIKERLKQICNHLDTIGSKICITKDGYKVKELLIDGRVEETPVGGITSRCNTVLSVQKKKSVKRVRGGTSGIKKGSTFHRQIYHELSCKKGSCSCREKLGTGHRKRTKGSDVDLWVSLALKFLDDKKLIPIRCEVPVKWDSVFVTEIDLLALCPATDRIVNVSWKTGYGSNCFEKASTFRNLIHRTGVNSSVHETHQLQQQMENSMLERSRFDASSGGGGNDGFKVTDNFIVYLGFDRKDSMMQFKPSQWRNDSSIVEYIERIFFSDTV